MRRRFNYTRRARLLEKDITISLAEAEGRKRFYMDLNLDGYGLPSDGAIWVEAYDRYNIVRFSYGTVADPSPAEKCVLDVFSDSDAFLFRIKVVAAGEHGKLLALAKSVRPIRTDDEAAPAKSLLRVATKALSGRVWDLEFYEAEHPVLLVDDRIEQGVSLPRQDLFFQALVFPAVFEKVLQWILLDTEYVPSGDPEPDDSWKEQWLDFAASIPGANPLPVDQELTADTKEEWIEECTRRFASDQKSVRKVRIALKEIET